MESDARYRVSRSDRATSSPQEWTLPTLDPEARWSFTPTVEPGAMVSGGDALGVVEERPGMNHKVLVPPGLEGHITEVQEGSFTVSDAVATLDDGTKLSLSHTWAIRERRPFARRLPGDRPFITGQRVFDLLFPVVEGGSVAVPGGFGTGKTVIEQSLAKYAKADIMVYIGCGERGERNGGSATRLQPSQRPRNGSVNHGSNGPDREHLEHACRRKRRIGLLGDDDRRVLPGHGLPRSRSRRFPFALGRSPSRDRRPPSRKCRAKKDTRRTWPIA